MLWEKRKREGSDYQDILGNEDGATWMQTEPALKHMHPTPYTCSSWPGSDCSILTVATLRCSASYIRQLLVPISQERNSMCDRAQWPVPPRISVHFSHHLHVLYSKGHQTSPHGSPTALSVPSNTTPVGGQTGMRRVDEGKRNCLGRSLGAPKKEHREEVKQDRQATAQSMEAPSRGI